tara:strand:- start:4660 stop:6117 length:1458 start_codon:yes stop_codon:yes gene_type:complete
MRNLLILFTLITIIFSCKKEENLNFSGNLNFSNDTILFDTIFSSIGSTTKTLTIYNNQNQNVVTNIELKGSSSANFRINVDGVSGDMHKDIIIPANDSIFIFIEVTINPSSSNTPYVLSDSLVFYSENYMQAVKLVAWGQDAYFHTANTYGEIINNSDTTKFYYHQIGCNEIWNDDKPHVIYGYAIIDPNCQLTINGGANIYLHSNSGIIVGNPFLNQNGGTLKVNGSLGNEVTFQGDRLESWYNDIPGQWDRIWLIPGSINNEINYAIIKNGTIGIHVDTVANNNPSLTINNTVIKNMSSIGLLGQGAKIKMSNSLITKCGQYTLACNIGGDYSFNHCSFINYWNYSYRNTPSILLNNYYEDIDGNIQIRELKNAYFGNCIIYGSLSTEVSFQKNNSGLYNYMFDHCLIKITEDTSSSNFNNCIINLDPYELEEIANNNFELLQGSPALNNGSYQISLDNNNVSDINNILRNNPPDLGLYESNF